jgi:hypothetical protein
MRELTLVFVVSDSFLDDFYPIRVAITFGGHNKNGGSILRNVMKGFGG